MLAHTSGMIALALLAQSAVHPLRPTGPSAPLMTHTANHDEVQPLAKSSSPTPMDILGRWKDEEYGSVVEVMETGGVFTGRTVSTPMNRVAPGTPIFRELKFEATQQNWVGKVYAPKRDKIYDATYRIEGGVLLMKVTFGPLWKNLKWVRVSSN